MTTPTMTPRTSLQPGAARGTGHPGVPVQGWLSGTATALARAVLAFTSCLFIWTLLPMALGWTPQVILSGSMAPAIQPGDVVITRHISPTALTPRQVVTVVDPDHDDGRTRTHRIVGRDSHGWLITKGDANKQADSSTIPPRDVLGLGVLRVPWIGRPAYWFRTRNYPALLATGLALHGCLMIVLGRGALKRPRRPPPPSTSSGGAAPRSRRARVLGVVAAAASVSLIAAAAPAAATFTGQTSNPTSNFTAGNLFRAYTKAVTADSPYLWWRMDLPAGTTSTSGLAIADASGNSRSGSLACSTCATGQTGVLTSEPAQTSLSVVNQGIINSSGSTTGLATFSVEAWVKTTDSGGGRIMGFGNQTGTGSTSTTIDRQLYLGADGKAYFVVGSAKTAISSTAVINNNVWHHLVGTYQSGSNGMNLYVDAVLQGSATATPQSFTGYWRAAAESLAGYPSAPDNYLSGYLQEVAVYSTALTATRVQAHYDARTSN